MARGVQVQVASREALGVKEEIFPAEDAVAKEEVAEEAVAEEALAEEVVAEKAVAEKAVAKEAVAEEVSREMGGEDEIVFKDQVGLEEEGEKDFLQEKCVILVFGFFLEGELGVVIVVKFFQGLPDAGDYGEAGGGRKGQHQASEEGEGQGVQVHQDRLREPV